MTHYKSYEQHKLCPLHLLLLLEHVVYVHCTVFPRFRGLSPGCCWRVHCRHRLSVYTRSTWGNGRRPRAEGRRADGDRPLVRPPLHVCPFWENRFGPTRNQGPTPQLVRQGPKCTTCFINTHKVDTHSANSFPSMRNSMHADTPCYFLTDSYEKYYDITQNPKSYMV